MTTKETNDEIYERFDFKIALSEKIDFNIELVAKYAKAAKEAEDEETRRECKRMARRGRKILSTQRTQRLKLSSREIAKQLGLDFYHVRYLFREYLGGGL